MIDLGIVKPGSTLYIPFNTYDSNDPSASATITGLAVGDIKIYKDGGTTERASTAGFTLLDTDGIDFDTLTGIHGFSIDLADNTTAGFYAAGSRYWVVVSDVTLDAATVRFVAATFTIGYPSALLNTTIATLSTQTSFTLTDGPAEDDALNHQWVMIHDVASEVQAAYAVISDYVGSTKTVTLAAAPTFTIAASDNIAICGPAPVQPDVAGRPLAINASHIADANVQMIINDATSATDLKDFVDAGYDPVTNKVQGVVLVDTTTTNTDMRGTDSAYTGTPPTAAAISDAVWDEATAGHTTAGTFGQQVSTDIDAILADTNELQSDDVPGLIAALNDVAATDIVSAGAITTLAGAVVNVDTVDTCTTNTDMRGTDSAATSAALATVDSNVDAILVDTNELQTDWTNGGRLDLLLDQVISDIAALNDISAADVNAQVLDVLNTDTFAEPSGVPAATASLVTKLGYLYMALRNRIDVTATKKTFYDDGGAAEWEKDLSDDGTTYSESEGNAI